MRERSGAMITTTKDGPYRWITPYMYISKEYTVQKRNAYEYISKAYPKYTEDDIRIVQLSLPTYDIFTTIAIYKDMNWDDFKTQLKILIKRNNDKFPYRANDIQNFGITYSPHEKAPSIDDNKYELYTIIPDNCIVFLNQMKINDEWIFLI